MPLTPDEIAAKSFPSVLRGYAKWEVDEFLKDVALDYQRALGLAEWAMQRSAAAPSDREAMSRPAPLLPNSSANSPVGESTGESTGQPGDTAESPGSTTTTAAQSQIDRLGEHIRYLAILVNSMSDRVDHVEARLAAKPTVPVYPEPTMSAPGSMPPPNGQNGSGSAHPVPVEESAKTESVYSPLVSAKDWWPTESPLSVVTRNPGTSAARNPYGPRA